MVSVWTVARAYQTFRQQSEIPRRAGEDARARRLDAVLERMRADFHEHLMPGGTVAVFARELGGWRVPAEELSVLLGPERNLVEIEL